MCAAFAKLKENPGTVVYAYNHSTKKVEAGGPISIRLA